MRNLYAHGEEAKRKLNIENHVLDFVRCYAFGTTSETRERLKGPHVISLRKAEKHETRYYRQVAKENLS